jgi:hypothetical protein
MVYPGDIVVIRGNPRPLCHEAEEFGFRLVVHAGAV